MKKVLLFASALFMLAACNSFKTDTYQDELVMPLADGGQDSLYFVVSLEYVTGGMLIPAMDQMNNTIVGQAFDLEEVSGTLEDNASRYRENLIDEYLNENGAPEEILSGVQSWEDRINGVFTHPWKKWVNYQLSYYSFRGGAHGIQTISCLVFDKKTGEVIPESALFAPGYQEPVAALMQEAVKTAMQAEDPELLALVELESVVPNGNFSVGEDGVQWVFQPYEVGPYALGLVTASLTWESLKPYLQ